MSPARGRRRRGVTPPGWIACAAAALLTGACGRIAGPAPPTTGAAASGAPPVAAAPPAWIALPALRPAWTATNRPGIAPDPYDASLLAVCSADGGVVVSRDGGSTWSSVSTAGVAKAVATDHLSAGPRCVDALPDPERVGSVYAAFTTAGAAPLELGAFTSDGGATWHLAGTALPPAEPTSAAGASPSGPGAKRLAGPPPVDPTGFGGFRATAAGAVQALFRRAGGAAAGLVVLQTSDGGATWTSGRLDCPAQGPCARWGPPGPGACGASGTLAQTVLIGPAWRSLDAGTDACHPYELAGAAGGTLALVSPAAAVLRVSTDGGETWSPVTMPGVPGLAGAAPAGALLLPDGSLLAVGKGWPQASSPRPVYVLRPGTAVWCPVRGVSLPAAVRDLTLAGGRLWWLPGAAGQPSSVPAASLHC